MEVIIQNLIDMPELSVSIALTVYMALMGTILYYICVPRNGTPPDEDDF